MNEAHLITTCNLTQSKAPVSNDDNYHRYSRRDWIRDSVGHKSSRVGQIRVSYGHKNSRVGQIGVSYGHKSSRVGQIRVSCGHKNKRISVCSNILQNCDLRINFHQLNIIHPSYLLQTNTDESLLKPLQTSRHTMPFTDYFPAAILFNLSVFNQQPFSRRRSRRDNADINQKRSAAQTDNYCLSSSTTKVHH